MNHIDFLVENYFNGNRELRRKQSLRLKELTGCAFGIQLLSYVSTYSTESAVQFSLGQS